MHRGTCMRACVHLDARLCTLGCAASREQGIAMPQGHVALCVQVFAFIGFEVSHTSTAR